MFAHLARIAGIARLYRPLVLSETQRALHPSMVHPFTTHTAFLMTTVVGSYHTQVSLGSSVISRRHRIGHTRCEQCPRSEKSRENSMVNNIFSNLASLFINSLSNIKER
jgi:hypothetical protein